jgi:threonine/homoserine/homoserine lactone efflux protein
VDLGILAAVAMLAVWAVLTFVMNDAPGITHALLTAGVALLVWRIVRRAVPAPPPPKNE